MNVQTINRASGAAVGLLLVGGLFAALTLVVKLAVPAPAIDAAPAADRSQALADLRATEADALANVGWVDQSRGLVRLPIDSALRLAADKWQNPAGARADLNARAEKAAAPAAPVAPQPSSFE